MDNTTNNDRFGLPLSLVEALKADPSDDAALLASYLTGVTTEVFNLDQLLADPLIKMVMASDHIVEDDIRAVMHRPSLQRRSADCLTGRLAA